MHIAIATLGLAILAFALWPSAAKRYERAIHEVEVLKQLPLDDFGRYAAAGVAAFPEANQLKLQIEASVRKAECSLPRDWKFDPTMFFPLDWGKPDKTDVGHLLSFFQRSRPIRVFVPDSGSFESSLLNWMHRLAPQLPRESRYVRDLKIELDTFADDVNAAPLRGKLGSEDGTQGILGSPGLVSGRVVNLKETSLMWIKQRPVGATLRFEGSPPTPMFPNLLNVADDVGNSDLNQAVSLLSQRRTLTQKDLSLFGVAIPGETALVVGPLAMLLALVYLLEHIRNVERIWRDRHDEGIVFPWIAIFPGHLPALLTHFSILGLTSSAMLGLLLRSFDSSSVLAWIGAGLALACGATACVISWTVVELRRDVAAGEGRSTAVEKTPPPLTAEMTPKN